MDKEIEGMHKEKFTVKQSALVTPVLAFWFGDQCGFEENLPGLFYLVCVSLV